jgi:hypothetical protein
LSPTRSLLSPRYVKTVLHPAYQQLWLSYAYFEIRRQDVTAARKVLGVSIGMCPKPKLFTGYIELEMRLREFDRVRTLYEKFLTVSFLIPDVGRADTAVRSFPQFCMDPVDAG